MNPLLIPRKRDLDGWDEVFQKHQIIGESRNAEIKVIGDSIVKYLSRYKQIWKHHFPSSTLNFGITGDRVQQVLWRVKFGCFPSVKTVIIHVGTNNIPKDQALHIAKAPVDLALLVKEKSAAHVILSGIFSRGETKYWKKLEKVNHYVETLLQKADLCDFLKPDENWPHRT